MNRALCRNYVLPTMLSMFVAIWASILSPVSVRAEVTAFKQAIAESAAQDETIAAFYRENMYLPIWTASGTEAEARRSQLLRALNASDAHGLPKERYDPDGLLKMMSAARTSRDLGRLEVNLSRVFLEYARDVQTGILIPSRVDSRIVRDVPYRDRLSYLMELSRADPVRFFRELPPQTVEYVALMRQKLRLEAVIRRGGWGRTVSAGVLKPGQSGPSVAALRDRLIAMGYLARTNMQMYDAGMHAAVLRFQKTHGLEPDGVAGDSTMREINLSAEARLRSVMVAMERERWMNRTRGARHVLVNIPDFSAKIIDNGKVTFETRAVVGANKSDRVTPEFSDVMEHMVVNPSWYVPRSIITKEYLPKLRQNPNAVSHIQIRDSQGRVINRAAVDFSQFTARTFPFSMRQPPSSRNALGLVKFMLPNKHNIYLHDTPAKNLFAREVRAFSHGCIRLADPFDFAHALLTRQHPDPEGHFKSVLNTGKETRVVLEQKVPVHIIYRTAFTDGRGEMQYRRDIYGRDAKIWDALSSEGVALPSVRG